MNGFYCSMIELDLRDITGEIMRITDAPYDITKDGHIYKSFGTLLAIDKITAENTLASRELNITLSGIAIEFQDAVNNNTFRRKSIIIWKAFIPEGTCVATESVIYWRGFTSTPETEINYEDGYMGLQVSCKSIFDLDQKPSLMRSNNATHQAYHQGDMFFAYATQDQKEDVMWKQ